MLCFQITMSAKIELCFLEIVRVCVSEQSMFIFDRLVAVLCDFRRIHRTLEITFSKVIEDIKCYKFIENKKSLSSIISTRTMKIRDNLQKNEHILLTINLRIVAMKLNELSLFYVSPKDLSVCYKHALCY